LPKRINFINIQLSHHVPCDSGEVSRVRTGYELVIPHLSGPMFAAPAKDDGKIIDINEKLKLVTVKYKNGETDIIKFGIEQGSVGGLYLDQQIVLNVKLNETIKRGEIIAYNPGFFVKDNDSKQVMWKHGVHANIALIDNDDTIEDSSSICKELGNKLSMKPTHLRPIKLSKNTKVYEMAKLNQFVKNTDYICIIEDEDISDLSIVDSEESYDYLLEINKKMPRAKNSGYISKIEVYYSCPIEEMSPSLAKLVNTINKEKTQKSNYAKSIGMENEYPKPTIVPKGTKLKGIEFDEDTVAFYFYITEDISCGVGDKVVFDSSLKSVISNVIDEKIKTTDDIEVDGLFGCYSINNRKVTSVFRVGILQRIFEKVDDMIIDIMEN
jgi:hypothetical protein